MQTQSSEKFCCDSIGLCEATLLSALNDEDIKINQAVWNLHQQKGRKLNLLTSVNIMRKTKYGHFIFSLYMYFDLLYFPKKENNNNNQLCKAKSSFQSPNFFF